MPEPAPGLARGRHWVRRFLFCNPFYLLSAAMLLYGVGETSAGAGVFRGEVPNLLFNFVSLQLYSALLLVAAVVLSRRGAWYDSALLVVLEHGLVLVPFMLVSLAALVGPSLGIMLVGAAAVAASTRAIALRRAYPRFNLPPRALAMGLVFLLLNAAGPLFMQSVVARTSVDEWAFPNLVIWNAILPVAALSAALLPPPLHRAGLEPERPWIPLLIHGLWVAGSGVHAWSLGYVCKQPFTAGLLAPALCAGLWAFSLRIADCLPSHAIGARRVLFPCIALVPLLAGGTPLRAFVLLALNHLAFLAVTRAGLREMRGLAGEYAVGSLAAAVMFLPERLLQQVSPPVPRDLWVLGVAGLYLLRVCWRHATPLLGMVGAVVVTLGTAVLAAANDPGCLVPQAALVWLLAHSNRWSRETGAADSRALRAIVAVAWMIHAAVSTRGVSLPAGLLTSAGAVVVLAMWGLECWRSARPRAGWVPLTALVVALSAPVNWVVDHGPAGLLAVVASFGAFGLGTGVAWTRRCWDPSPHP
jgi:hypothetical protein